MGRAVVTSGSARLKSAIVRFRQAQAKGVDQAPGCVFGLMTRDGLDDLQVEMGRLRDSVNNLNKVLVGLLVSVVLSAIGIILSGVLSP